MAEDTRRYYGMDLPRSKGPHPDPLTDAPTPPVGEERVSDERLAHLITAYGFDRTNREWHLILTELQERRRSPPAPGAEDLVERLRALARAEHDDLSVADEAADVLYEREHRNKAAALPGKATDDPAYLAAHAKADTNKRFAALCRSALPKEKET